MKKDFKIIKWIEDKIFLVKSGRDYSIVFTDYNDTTIEKSKFKNLSFSTGVVNGKESIILEGSNDSVLVLFDTMYTLGADLSEAIVLLKETSATSEEDILKWRGDIAEAIFLMLEGGEKLDDTSTADIEKDGDLVEIKSYSLRSREIHLSYSQIMENTKKIALLIQLDSDGMTIKEIASQIKGNIKFKEYINNAYRDNLFAEYKVKVTTPEDITDRIVKFDVPDQYTQIKLVMKV